jgi:hypothetical protein
MFIRKMRWTNRGGEEEEEFRCNEWAIVKLLTRKIFREIIDMPNKL